MQQWPKLMDIANIWTFTVLSYMATSTYSMQLTLYILINYVNNLDVKGADRTAPVSCGNAKAFFRKLLKFKTGVGVRKGTVLPQNGTWKRPQLIIQSLL